MNKMQVKTTLVNLDELKDELIEKKKKAAEELAIIETEIEAVMTLIPVFMKKEDITVTVKEPEVKTIAIVTDMPVKAEPEKRLYSKGLTPEERKEKDRKSKYEWYLRNRERLKAKNKKALEVSKPEDTLQTETVKQTNAEIFKKIDATARKATAKTDCFGGNE